VFNMATPAPSELLDFGQLVLNLVAAGEAGLSPEQALHRWKLENLSPHERDEDIAAIEEALADMAAGDRGTPVNDFLQQLDAKLGIPPRP
jgi:hypothetical protein